MSQASRKILGVSSCCSEGKQNQRVCTRLPQSRAGGQGLCLRSLDYLVRSNEAKVSYVEGDMLGSNCNNFNL